MNALSSKSWLPYICTVLCFLCSSSSINRRDNMWKAQVITRTLELFTCYGLIYTLSLEVNLRIHLQAEGNIKSIRSGLVLFSSKPHIGLSRKLWRHSYWIFSIRRQPVPGCAHFSTCMPCLYVFDLKICAQDEPLPFRYSPVFGHSVDVIE